MTFELNNKELEFLLLNGTKDEIEKSAGHIHPVDVLDILDHYKGNAIDLLSKLPEWLIVEILDEAEDERKFELLSLFPDIQRTEIIEEMSSDELVDLLGSMEPDDANEIILKMDPEDAQEVRELLSYPPDTAGGIMATEFIAVKERMDVKEILKYLQKQAPDAEMSYYIYVVDDQERLKGVISLRDIVTATFDTPGMLIMDPHVISVPVTMDQEKVARLFEKYGYLTIPVVDEKNKLLGIVTFDDVIQILREEDTKDLYRLAGIQEDVRTTGSLRNSVTSRLPWLFVNLFTALIASGVISLFQDTIGRAVLLAAFMPIVSGMGGNAGTQTLTIIVRGMALGELNFYNYKKILIREVGVGFISGLSIGLCVALISGLLANKPILGLVIGFAMILNMTVATFVGFMVPVILKKLKVDPALASSTFVTATTDVLGFLFFLGLATIFIEYLV